MQLILVSGQSSTLQQAAALATASYAAKKGRRVLVVGTGPVSLLSHLLHRPPDAPISHHPTPIAPNLDAMDLVAIEQLDRGWEELLHQASGRVPAQLLHIRKDELPSFPGMDEVASLLVANRMAKMGTYDLIVYSGTTIDSLLRGMSLRDTIRWFVRLIGGLDRGPGRSQRSLETALLPISILSASTHALLQDIRIVFEQYTNWLSANAGTRIRLVFSASDISLPMMRHVLGGAGLYGLHVDAILVHGDLDTIDHAVRERCHSLFVPLPFSPTPTDIAGWAERGTMLYDHLPEDLRTPKQTRRGPPPLIASGPIRLHIPFLDRKSLDIGVASEEVIVRMGPFRRHLLVPGMEREGAKLRARTEGEFLHLWVE